MKHDPDMRLPEWVLHFFPVVLALFFLTMSVAGESVFYGFEEDEPITWMSVTLMLAVLVTLLAVVRDRGLAVYRRWAAGVLSAVTLFAVLDETIGWHEEVGRWVKDELEVFTRDVRHYTDDFIVILFALVGATLLLLFVRRLENRRSYLPYIACAGGMALAHGVLDVLGHGRRIWRALDPEITRAQVSLLTDVLSVYEEACKLWAAWFVLLFVLRLFHRQRGPLGWSLLVMAGSFLAPIGLWSIEDPAAGVPYVVMEGTLEFLRNYPLLLTLGVIFAAWSTVVWVSFHEQPEKRALAGLFFFAPFYADLGALAAVPGGGIETFGVVGLGVAGVGVALTGWAIWRWRQVGSFPALAAALGALLLGLLSFSAPGLAEQPLRLLTVGGLLLPVAAWLVVRARPGLRAWPWIAIAGIAVVAVHDPLWLLAVFGLSVFLAVETRDEPLAPSRWAALVALQGALIAAVFYLSAAGILPEYDFEPPEKVVFETGRQPIDLDYYRRDD